MTEAKKNILYVIYWTMLVLCIAFFAICKFYYNYVLLFLAVTLLTMFSHFTIRISCANFVCQKVIKKYDYKSWYFCSKKIEKPLYKLLLVKKWKNKLPTWTVEDFDLRKNEPKAILTNMCKAEMYHLVCVILSFLPILFAIPFGKFYVFLITSVFGAAYDLLFVIIQRYNRPRLEKLFL